MPKIATDETKTGQVLLFGKADRAIATKIGAELSMFAGFPQPVAERKRLGRVEKRPYRQDDLV
ncbi:hypothetical protein [Bradyrhizobium uaiense]|uniref:Uncharacterized protein n=1 Tax=Bradyrhizobium uaiense TaxID=2594946 RepID=A0A6P1BPB3_9BRAD|nr:hypothetical protein [Bradyrhizobium uaiense]NEU99490.1 hypothetical protein [Bradyrhizobium uaiense]